MLTKQHVKELSSLREKYEDTIANMESNHKKEKQAILASESSLRRQLEEAEERFGEERRNMRYPIPLIDDFYPILK
jgi:hypothetical protein